MSSTPAPLSPPAAPPAPLAVGLRLDESALTRLRELDPDGRHGVLKRVLQAFDSSLSRMLVQLTAHGARTDPSVISGIAHTLKSSAASVGAMRLSEACAEVEKRQRGAGDRGLLSADVEHLHREGQAALTAARSMLRA